MQESLETQGRMKRMAWTLGFTQRNMQEFKRGTQSKD